MALVSTGRDIPLLIPGSDEFSSRPRFTGTSALSPRILPKGKARRGDAKICATLDAALDRAGVESGMTISFHHHFREGDRVVNLILDALARRGVRDLVLAPSSLTTCHAPLIEHIKRGVIREIRTSGLRGPLADAISGGILDTPILIHSHGGRARALDSGEFHIDVAFLGVPSCDSWGNATGSRGPSLCGSMGYAMVDARNADRVILLTEEIIHHPAFPVSIRQDQVDAIIKVDSVGDPAGISRGATRMTRDPRELLIARTAVKAIDAAGIIRNGFAFQSGSGGASLAAIRFIREIMIQRSIKASFALGGITSQIVSMHEEGLVPILLDTQSFDGEAARSLATNHGHREIDASQYANPMRKGAFVENLDVVILSAMEIDPDFNVNVITGSDGVIRGASGGHCDTAAGAGLTVVVAPLLRGRLPTVMDRVATIITPGESVDLFVTDRGIAVNPKRPDLADSLARARIPVVGMESLKKLAESYTGIPAPLEFEDRIVGVVEYRDGSILDVIRKPKGMRP